MDTVATSLRSKCAANSIVSLHEPLFLFLLYFFFLDFRSTHISTITIIFLQYLFRNDGLFNGFASHIKAQ